MIPKLWKLFWILVVSVAAGYFGAMAVSYLLDHTPGG